MAQVKVLVTKPLFHTQNLHGGRREQIPATVLWIPHALTCMHSHTCTHVHTHTIHTHIYIPSTYTHTNIHTCTATPYTHMHIHTPHTYAHIPYTYIHTIHTHRQPPYTYTYINTAHTYTDTLNTKLNLLTPWTLSISSWSHSPEDILLRTSKHWGTTWPKNLMVSFWGEHLGFWFPDLFLIPTHTHVYKISLQTSNTIKRVYPQ